MVAVPDGLGRRLRDMGRGREIGLADAQIDDVAPLRREVEEFNERVIWARYQLPAGPPLITMPRDTEATVAAWAARREARAEESRRRAAEEVRACEEAWMSGRKRRRFFGERIRRRS